MSDKKLGKKMAIGGSAIVVALGLLALTVAGCGSGSTQAGAQATVVTTTPASSAVQNSLLDTITVSGTGTVNTLPDEAVIQIEVDSSAATASRGSR